MPELRPAAAIALDPAALCCCDRAMALFARVCTLCCLLACTCTPAWAKSTAGRFTVAADGKTVHDKVTKLTWQRDPPGTGGPNNDGRYGWADAKTYCANNTAGLSGTGWRLPGVRELRSLLDLK
jgi:hypothetical protein